MFRPIWCIEIDCNLLQVSVMANVVETVPCGEIPGRNEVLALYWHCTGTVLYCPGAGLW